MIWLILTPSFWFIITILAYIAYTVKNKEFLAFTLTPAFWKSFFLGFFVGFFLGGILSFELSLFILSIVFSIVFSILKAIFRSQKIVILDTKKKHQRINFAFMCGMGIPFVSSIIFSFPIAFILYFLDNNKHVFF